MRTTTITIHQRALSHNLSQVKQHAPTSKVLAMVKADAYGHGLAACLPALNTADGVGVAYIDEAIQARLLGWDKSIVMIEGAFSQLEWRHAMEYDISCVIHYQDQVEWALAYPSTKYLQSMACSNDTVWLKLNTGMNRLGFEPDEIIDIAMKLHNTGYQIILTSHFANADEKKHPLNTQQINVFNHTLNLLHTNVSADIGASFCNSAAIINFPSCHYDWVRPGIMLYGSSPVADKTAQDLNLKSVMCFKATLIAIHEVDKNCAIGYGSLYVTPTPTIKGVISVGYGDGYPRVVNNSAWVGLLQDDQCYQCPIIGRVAMDMITIDLSHVPSPILGSKIILWGTDSSFDSLNCPSIDEVATSAGTISYELLCRMTQRPKRYII